MSSEKEPFRLGGRRAIVAGADNQWSRSIAAKLSAAGACATVASVNLPLPAKLSTELESIDILVLQSIGDIDDGIDSTASEWEKIEGLHRRHVTLPSALMAKAVPAMRHRRWGRVVFAASVGDRAPAAIAARSAQSALMQAEARQLAADGVTVNLILATPDDSTDSEELTATVAAAVLYFAGEESSFVTGQTLQIGGGA
jgi:NAD(P)-dependent dehydrogenase (short-subunit alcohol dehydrogenase family)